MSQSYVQTHTGGHAQSGLNPTCSVVSANGGNHLRLNIRYSSNNRFVSSISDGHNTWHSITKATDGATNNGQEMWYAENCAAGTYTVTLTMDSSAATNIEVFIDEFSGTATSSSLDQSAQNGATTGASPLAVGPTSATTSANENVYTVAMSINASNARPLTNPPSGFTADFNGSVNSQATQFSSAHKNVTSTGTQSVSWAWTGGNSNSTGIIATFKDAAGSAATDTDSAVEADAVSAITAQTTAADTIVFAEPSATITDAVGTESAVLVETATALVSIVTDTDSWVAAESATAVGPPNPAVTTPGPGGMPYMVALDWKRRDQPIPGVQDWQELTEEEVEELVMTALAQWYS